MDGRLNALLQRLPHQPPMRLVEQVLEVIPGLFARTQRHAKAHDWYFDGHFPGEPVVPAVVLVELIAQTAGLAMCSDEAAGPPIALRVAALSNFKFPAPATPGALLEATARVVGRFEQLTKVDGQATADGKVVALGSVTLAAVTHLPGS